MRTTRAKLDPSSNDLLFGSSVTAIIPRPLRPQFGAPVADGLCAGFPAGRFPVEC
jgi:hypothetical protein